MKKAEPAISEDVDFVVVKWGAWYEEDLEVLGEEWNGLYSARNKSSWALKN